MRLPFLVFFLLGTLAFAQTNAYTLSFDNAVHHEAVVCASFPEIKTATLLVEMARSSPGRYALHEFAKNVYGVVATSGAGDTLAVTRPDPYSWEIENRDGTINVHYTLFANRGDGTYSQVDETHAHLNIPATFMYAKALEHRPIEVEFKLRADLKWKVATQFKKLTETKYRAPDLYYFMDSPVEISDHKVKEFELDGQNIRFVLHDPGTEEDFQAYFEKVKKIVEQEKAVYGELPNYDYGEYTFLACYMPNVSGDGMEHRNSTILTDSETLANGGMKANIGTVSHEYFHTWNVERIRPEGLEPFDFAKANRSDALWFAEGFTSYYTNLILERAGIITPQEYVAGLNGTFNYVWNSPAHQYFNPMEMSMQAPFVDAATSVDPVNRENTFISYYSYGSVLGLALDLSLRALPFDKKENPHNLDDFMKLMWHNYGRTEVAYSIKDIEQTLGDYAGIAFAKAFFDPFIYKSEMPGYEALFASVGLTLKRNNAIPSTGLAVEETEDGLVIARNPAQNTAGYEAGLDLGDTITSINGEALNTVQDLETLIKIQKTGAKLKVVFTRFGNENTTTLKLKADSTYTIEMMEKPDKNAKKARTQWLAGK